LSKLSLAGLERSLIAERPVKLHLLTIVG